MRKVIPPMTGAITVEYLLVASALMLSVWFAVAGGPGDWRDIDRPYRESAMPLQTRSPHEVNNPPPNLIKTLNDRQHDFAREIYQP
jgi:hypothetical protein